jgi:hypothetical protein
MSSKKKSGAVRRPSASATPSAQRRRGGLLAVRMLEEIEKTGIDRCHLLDEHRARGTPQRDVAAKYLRKLTDPEVAAGFSAILTYALASAADGNGIPVLPWLELLATRSPEEARVEWDVRGELEAARLGRHAVTE